MDHMRAPQQPIDLGTQTPDAVIEFGSPPRSAPSARRRRFTDATRGLVGDRRVVPLAAALGAVATFTSLVSEWQVTRVDRALLGDGETGVKVIPVDLSDLGGFAGGYLAGLFLLVAAVTLTMFGPVPGRGYARTAGLAVGGSLLALLLAVTALLTGQSRIFSRVYTLQLDAGQISVSYGRGLWCALFGVVAATVALYLAGRHTSRRPVDDRSVPGEEAVSWWRPGSVDEDPPPDVPFELTVTSTRPFTSHGDDRDKPA